MGEKTKQDEVGRQRVQKGLKSPPSPSYSGGGSWEHFDGGRRGNGRGPVGWWGGQISDGQTVGAEEIQTGERGFTSVIHCCIRSSSTHPVSLKSAQLHHHQGNRLREVK